MIINFCKDSRIAEASELSPVLAGLLGSICSTLNPFDAGRREVLRDRFEPDSLAYALLQDGRGLKRAGAHDSTAPVFVRWRGKMQPLYHHEASIASRRLDVFFQLWRQDPAQLCQPYGWLAPEAVVQGPRQGQPEVAMLVLGDLLELLKQAPELLLKIIRLFWGCAPSLARGVDNMGFDRFEFVLSDCDDLLHIGPSDKWFRGKAEAWIDALLEIYSAAGAPERPLPHPKRVLFGCARAAQNVEPSPGWAAILIGSGFIFDPLKRPVLEQIIAAETSPAVIAEVAHQFVGIA